MCYNRPHSLCIHQQSSFQLYSTVFLVCFFLQSSFIQSPLLLPFSLFSSHARNISVYFFISCPISTSCQIHFFILSSLITPLIHLRYVLRTPFEYKIYPPSKKHNFLLKLFIYILFFKNSQPLHGPSN